MSGFKTGSVMIMTVASILATGCTDGTMTFPGTEWEKATPQSQHMDPAKLDAAVAFLGQELKDDRDGINELMIIRNGYLLHEGPGVDSVHTVFSGAKSFTSLMMGLAMDDGLCGLDDKVAKDLPEMQEKYPDVTYRQLLIQTSGYNATKKKPFAFGDPNFKPGEYFEYGAPWFSVVLRSLTRKWNRTMASVLEERICSKIGVDRNGWNWEDFGVVDPGFPEVNGNAPPFINMCINARQYARIGWLLANDGVWNGDILLSSAFVKEMASVQVPAEVAPLDSTAWYKMLPGAYGLGCWVNGVKRLDGERLFPNAPERTWVLQGNKNNCCFIIPEWNMVVVRTGNHKNVDVDWSGFFMRLGTALL